MKCFIEFLRNAEKAMSRFKRILLLGVFGVAVILSGCQNQESDEKNKADHQETKNKKESMEKTKKDRRKKMRIQIESNGKRTVFELNNSRAAGHLASPPQWKSNSRRGRTDQVAAGKYDSMEQQYLLIVKRVRDLAEKYQCKISQISLAWQWAKGVTAPILGAAKARYFDDVAGALNVKLTQEDLNYLEELYKPRPIVGAIDKNPKQNVMLLDEKNKVVFCFIRRFEEQPF